MKKQSKTLLFVILMILTTTSGAIACACCANAGYRDQSKLPVSSYDIDVLSALKPAGPGNLYVTACADECVIGINWFDETVATSFGVSGNLITIVLNANTSARTVLSAQIPEELTYSASDPKPGDGSLTISLRSEFQIPLQLFGSGPGWTGGAKAVSANLILLGQGNACPDIEMTNYWLLDVGGPKDNAWFRLYGKILHKP